MGYLRELSKTIDAQNAKKKLDGHINMLREAFASGVVGELEYVHEILRMSLISSGIDGDVCDVVEIALSHLEKAENAQ